MLGQPDLFESTLVLRRAWDLPTKEQQERRANRLRAVYEGRARVIDELRLTYPIGSPPRRFSSAIVKYQRARKAWRFFLGHS